MKPATASELIDQMRALPQSAAAWLLGIRARTIRDHPEIPRQDNGRFDARDLVKWSAVRASGLLSKLTDADAERAMLAAEALYVGLRPGELATVFDDLCRIRAEHGDAGLLGFLAVLLELWSEVVEDDRPYLQSPVPEYDASAAAAAAYACPSKRSPFNAKNTSPGRSERESVDKPSTTTARAALGKQAPMVRAMSASAVGIIRRPPANDATRRPPPPDRQRPTAPRQ